MARGDQLQVRFGLYHHHGIDMGDQTVIHFGTGDKKKHNAVVSRVSLEQFCDQRPLTIVDSPAVFSTDEICRRAEQGLERREYHLFENNCEHFAMWCRCGVSQSLQAWQLEQDLQTVSAVGIKALAGQAVVSKTISTSSLSKILQPALGGSLTSLSLRKLTPWLIVADVVEFSSKRVTSRLGGSNQQAEQVGRCLGIATSAALGLTVAGRVGAIAGVAIWGTSHIAARQITKLAKSLAAGNSVASAQKT